jgi:hypothetical protein
VLLGAIGMLAACGGGRHLSATTTPHSARLNVSPCRGVDPWRGAALRRCTALVSRWAPVHSLRLTTRLAPRVRATCEQARRQARMPVVCPPLIPTGGVVRDPGLYGVGVPAHVPPARDSTGTLLGAFYFLTFNNGDNPGYTHWIVGAGRGDSVQRNLFNPRQWEVPGRTRRLGQRAYGPWTITFYRFPAYPSGGPLGGHDLGLTKVDGTTYFASVHGRNHHDASAAMLTAILLTADASR